ncbi:DUF2752 domain-containing protein [Enterococcus gallinarum]|nr:DUF2752 domain-containing protein [Enterococcus gallinarum]
MDRLLMCPFKLLTGVPCPGCGMTRAYLHLLKVTYKALFIFIHFLAHSFASVTCHFLEKPMVQRINQNRYFWLGLMIAVLGVYGYRMWHFFPDQAPMDFDPKALLPQVITKLVAFIA